MRLVKWLLVLFVLSAAALVLVVGYHGYRSADDPFQGYSGEEVFFNVEKGASGARIAEGLEEKGIVSDRRVFLAALRLRQDKGTIKAGEYRFAGPLSTIQVLDRLVAGDVFTFPVTIPEGLTLMETAEHLARLGLGNEDALRGTFEQSGNAVADLDPGARNLEGYLYPTTYRFTRGVQPGEVTRTMVAQFKQIFGEVRRERARALGLTPRQVVTLASVIEKETGVPAERPLIGSVFLNRLDRGMPLQSDPTIIYALKLEGRYNGNLRKTDLDLDTPYNTYRFPGLPPGPIASPGEAAIDAVLFPADSKYLYFVSKNDGSHHFSSTYREHIDAVHKYQVEYFRRRRRNGDSGSR
jgi:peptidoglycan lytic transglycosylase G